MTTFFLAMLAITIIVMVARYNGSANLASNLLLTLAFSVAVGLGIQFVTQKSDTNKNTKVENVTTNSMATPFVSALEPDTVCPSGMLSKPTNYVIVTDTTKGTRNPIVNSTTLYTRGAPPFPDTS